MVIFIETKTNNLYLYNLLLPTTTTTNLSPLHVKIFKFQVGEDLRNKGFL